MLEAALLLREPPIIRKIGIFVLSCVCFGFVSFRGIQESECGANRQACGFQLAVKNGYMKKRLNVKQVLLLLLLIESKKKELPMAMIN